jgi:hypothetical protein
MRFLALTGFQAALLTLITAGAIVALYFLKLRHRRIVVASSLLWKRVLDETHVQSLWEKLRRLASIVLAVIIGLSIALALGRPEVHWLTRGGERTLLVLDTSPSMLARTSDGQTRWQHAVDAAIGIVNSSAPSSEFRVADTNGRIDTAPTSDRSRIREAIERMKPMAGTARFPESDPETTNVRFITDGVVPLTLPRGTIRESVFEAAENVGITAFEIRSTPSSPLAHEAYVEAHNYGRQRQQTTLTITGAGGQRIDRVLSLEPGGEFGEPFDLSRFEGGGIRAAVQSEGDALSADDVAFAYLPTERKTRTLLVTNGNQYLEALLSLDSLVDLVLIKPAQYKPDPSFDAYIFDGFAPSSAPPRPSLFIGEIPETNWLPKPAGAIQKPRFVSWIEDHPVMRHVSLHDVFLDRASRVDRENLTVLAEAADQSPLILATSESQRPRWVVATFNLANSDLPLHSGFPLLIDNAIAWLSREALALRRQPGLVTVPIAQAQIKELNGASIESHARGASTVFEATEPGLYIAQQEDVRQYVAVNLASPQYSNVNRTASRDAEPAALTAGWLQQELWFYLLAIASLLLGLEWFTYHRGITV